MRLFRLVGVRRNFFPSQASQGRSFQVSDGDGRHNNALRRLLSTSRVNFAFRYFAARVFRVESVFLFRRHGQARASFRVDLDFFLMIPIRWVNVPSQSGFNRLAFTFNERRRFPFANGSLRTQVRRGAIRISNGLRWAIRSVIHPIFVIIRVRDSPDRAIRRACLRRSVFF